MPTSHNRRRILKAAAAMGAYALSGHSRGATSKPFEGVELNVSCWSAPFPKLLQGYLPEFEQLTGIKVNYDTPGFLIYNQRVYLELSTKGSSYDVLNITFIYVDRWLRAGWFAPLNDFLKDESATPKGWDVDDFLPATRKIMSVRRVSVSESANCSSAGTPAVPTNGITATENAGGAGADERSSSPGNRQVAMPNPSASVTVTHQRHFARKLRPALRTNRVVVGRLSATSPPVASSRMR